jgi:hypothetical protein
MAIVKPRISKTKEMKADIVEYIYDEAVEYADWAKVSLNDVIEHALGMLFKEDADWNNRATTTTQLANFSLLGKVATIRKAFAKLASVYDKDKMTGGVDSSEVIKLIHETFGRPDVPANTCIAQTSTFNRLVRNENNLRASLPKEWEALKTALDEYDVDADSLSESFKKSKKF